MGTVSSAINMGDEENCDKWEAVANGTPDGKHILFNRGADLENDHVDTHWVDTH